MRGMGDGIYSIMLYNVLLIEYEKERSDSNQKYKTAPPPNAARCVQNIISLSSLNHFYRNSMVMSLPHASNNNTATPLPRQFLSNFTLSSIRVGSYSPLSESSSKAHGSTSVPTTNATKGHSSNDAIVID